MTPADVRRTLAALALGAAAGAASAMVGAPLPWLLGPFAAVAAASLLGADLGVPRPGRSLAQIVIGVAIGLYLTQDLLHAIVGIFPFILGAATASIAASGVLAVVLMRFTGIDRPTAFFGSMPGGVAEMSTLAEQFGGDATLVALAQAIRIAVVVMVVPPAIYLLAPPFAPDSLGAGAATTGNLLELGAMLVAACAFSALLSRTGFANHALMGGILAGGLAACLELSAARVPAPLLDLSQLLIGCALGARFSRGAAAGVGRLILAIVAGLLAFLTLAALMAVAISAATGIDVWTMILATIPGGIAEASITAKALHLGVGEVAAFHLVRIVLVITFCAPLFRLTRHFAGRDQA